MSAAASALGATCFQVSATSCLCSGVIVIVVPREGCARTPVGIWVDDLEGGFSGLSRHHDDPTSPQVLYGWEVWPLVCSTYTSMTERTMDATSIHSSSRLTRPSGK